MFHRGRRPASSLSALPEDAFTLDVEDLYAESSTSAAVAVSLLAKGAEAGVASNPSLAPRSTKKNFLKNAAGTTRNEKLKGTQWPDLSWFSHTLGGLHEAIRTDGLMKACSLKLPPPIMSRVINQLELFYALAAQCWVGAACRALGLPWPATNTEDFWF